MLITLLLGLFCSVIHAQTLVLNDTNGPPFTTKDGDGFLDLVVRRIFNEAGLSVRLVRLPAERALRNANAGIDDGELTRIKGIDETYTSLVMLPESIIRWDFVALTRDKTIQVRNWKDLEKYNIGYIRGWKILERNTRNCRNVSIVSSPDELFAMLDKGRIDIALYSKWMGLAIVKRKNMQGVRVLSPPLEQREMYIYLNKKHSAHVEKITAALRKLKNSGEYQRLFDQTVKTSLSIIEPR